MTEGLGVGLPSGAAAVLGISSVSWGCGFGASRVLFALTCWGREMQICRRVGIRWSCLLPCLRMAVSDCGGLESLTVIAPHAARSHRAPLCQGQEFPGFPGVLGPRSALAPAVEMGLWGEKTLVPRAPAPL